MLNNPELKRNIWLEITTHRIVVTPIVYLLLFGSIMANSNKLDELKWAANTFFIVGAIVYGAFCAASSVASEVRGGTWVSQQLTSLTGWQMTVGKLLGSTLYPWYIGIYPLVVSTICTLSLDGPIEAIRMLIFWVALVLFFQASAFLPQMESLDKDKQRRRGIIVWIFLGLIAVNGLTGVFVKTMMEGGGTQALVWYGSAYQISDFFLVSAVVFALWSVFGSYRLMLRALMYRIGPIAWACFSIFLIFYCCGFVSDQHAWTIHTALTCTVVPAYLLCIYETFNRVTYRKFGLSLRQGDWEEAYLATPRWIVSLILLILVSVVAFVVQSGTARVSGFSITLFLVRDLAILFVLRLSKKGKKRAESAFFVYLFILYMLFPFFLGALGADADSLSMLFWPHVFYWVPGWTTQTSAIGIVLCPALQALLALFLLRNSIKHSGRTVE